MSRGYCPMTHTEGRQQAPERSHIAALVGGASMLSRENYCDSFHENAAGIAVAARRGLTAPVPSCPGWSVASLITHLTADVYATRVRQFEALPEDARLESYADLKLPARF